MGYLFDTNIVSAFLRYNEKVLNKIKEVTDRGEKLFVSVITDYEVNRGLMITNATTKLKHYEFLRGQVEMLWIDSLALSKQAAEIHAYLRRIRPRRKKRSFARPQAKLRFELLNHYLCNTTRKLTEIATAKFVCTVFPHRPHENDNSLILIVLQYFSWT